MVYNIQDTTENPCKLKLWDEVNYNSKKMVIIAARPSPYNLKQYRVFLRDEKGTVWFTSEDDIINQNISKYL